jgi:hypothetical protein
MSGLTESEKEEAKREGSKAMFVLMNDEEFIAALNDGNVSLIVTMAFQAGIKFWRDITLKIENGEFNG